MFSQIVITKEVPANVIARVNHTDSTLQINPDQWMVLDHYGKEFVLLHEMSHLILNETDEVKTNFNAITMFLERGNLKGDLLQRRSWLIRLPQEKWSNAGDGFFKMIGDLSKLVETGLDKLFPDKDNKQQREFESQMYEKVTEENSKNRFWETVMSDNSSQNTVLIIGGVALVVIGFLFYKSI